jgi:hypothetical protein
MYGNNTNYAGNVGFFEIGKTRFYSLKNQIMSLGMRWTSV